MQNVHDERRANVLTRAHKYNVRFVRAVYYDRDKYFAQSWLFHHPTLSYSRGCISATTYIRD